MRHRTGSIPLLSGLVVLVALLAGCQAKPDGGLDLTSLRYTNRQVSVRVAPDPDASTLVMAPIMTAGLLATRPRLAIKAAVAIKA